MQITKEHATQLNNRIEQRLGWLKAGEEIDMPAFIADVRESIAIMRGVAAEPELQEDQSFGFCKEKAKNGGCQLHNLQCGYPACDKRPKAEPVPMTEEKALELAHRRATTYTHRSAPNYSSYAFVPYTLMDFVRDLEAHHGIKPKGK